MIEYILVNRFRANGVFTRPGVLVKDQRLMKKRF